MLTAGSSSVTSTTSTFATK